MDAKYLPNTIIYTPPSHPEAEVKLKLNEYHHLYKCYFSPFERFAFLHTSYTFQLFCGLPLPSKNSDAILILTYIGGGEHKKHQGMKFIKLKPYFISNMWIWDYSNSHLFRNMLI